MQLATDDFNRANGGLGANWTTIGSGESAPAIVSNQACNGDIVSHLTAGAFYSALTWSNDHWSQIQVAAATTGNVNQGATARVQSGAVRSYYICYMVGPAGGTCTVGINKRVNGVNNALWTSTATVNVNDVIAIGVRGTSISYFLNGVLLQSVSDTSFSSGFPGFEVSVNSGVQSDSIVDNWAAGDYSMEEYLTLFDDVLFGALRGTTLQDTLALTDDVLRGVRQGRTIDEALPLNDDLAASRKYTRLLDELLPLIDDLTALKSGGQLYVVSLDEFLVVFDQEFSVIAYNRQLDEPLAAADQALIGILRGVTADDLLTLNDLLAAGALRGLTVDDLLTTIDDLLPATLRGRTLDDPLTANDLVAAGALRGVTVDEAAVLVELTGATVNRQRGVDDSLGLSDDLQYATQYVRDLIEGLVTADDLIAQYFHVVVSQDVRIRLGAENPIHLGSESAIILGGYN